jgi:glycerol-3-phosphate dehydrogenase
VVYRTVCLHDDAVGISVKLRASKLPAVARGRDCLLSGPPAPSIVGNLALNEDTTRHPCYDLLVVGGGVNGAGIARDAAGRGLRVCLSEQDDLASHTSSKSTKLIHGGLRYLEHFEFKLVRESLLERAVLLRSAPHIIWPMKFVLPHDNRLRPVWMIRLGLWLYDNLGGRDCLPSSRAIDLRHHAAGLLLNDGFRRAFEYWDCWVQDARLVVLSAMDAAERGAKIMSRTKFVSARAEGSEWLVTLQTQGQGEQTVVRCRAIINAAGPWVKEVLGERVGVQSQKRVRLVAGSHIIVPRLHQHEHAFIFQNPDQRIVFAIPYERHFTLIGTTERELDNEPRDVEITRSEIDYLCRSVNRFCRQPIAPGEVISTYSGVRALFDDAPGVASKVTRDYVLEMERVGGAPVLSVFGGKITTFRRLAETAIDSICETLGLRTSHWTETAQLPGGDLPQSDFDAFLWELKASHPWLSPNLAWRYARNYGSRAEQIIDGAKSVDALGEEIASGLFEAELEYLITNEWVREAQDLLWRRTKLGLHLSAVQCATVAERIARVVGATPPGR